MENLDQHVYGEGKGRVRVVRAYVGTTGHGLGEKPEYEYYTDRPGMPDLGHIEWGNDGAGAHTFAQEVAETAEKFLADVAAGMENEETTHECQEWDLDGKCLGCGCQTLDWADVMAGQE